jgi:alanyl-tRNA synthetase
VALARQDFAALTEAAALFSSHVHDLPQQIRKVLDQVKAAGKTQQKLLDEIATLEAARMLAEAQDSPRFITRVFADRDASFIKLLAQKLTTGRSDVIALLAGLQPQPTLVFAQGPGQKFNMGQLLKESLSQLGGRGGGSSDMAQGGLPHGSADFDVLTKLVEQARAKLSPA